MRRTLETRQRLLDMLRASPNIVERFWAKLIVTDGCWTLDGKPDSEGYSYLSIGGGIKRPVRGHEVAWFVAHNDLPPFPLELDHLCRNRPCVRLDHLESVEHIVNVHRGQSPGMIRSRLSFCPQGHAYTLENTCLSCGTRFCLTCKREHERQRRELNPKLNQENWAKLQADPIKYAAVLAHKRAHEAERRRLRKLSNLIQPEGANV